MLFQLICLGLAARVVSAVPAGASLTLQGRDNSTSDSNVTNSAQPSLALFQDNSTHPFSLPARDNSSDRAAKIQQKRLGFLYGPSPVNDASYFPAGPLGQAVAALDIAELNGSVSAFKLLVNEDVQGVVSAAQTWGGPFTSLANWTRFYDDGLWNNSVPERVDSGILTNFTTDDRTFSMGQLSMSPFQIKRLSPNDSLPFDLDSSVAPQVAGMDLATLQSSGRLFYTDWRTLLLNLELNLPLYGAACDAYFYISPNSSDFLPLAVRARPSGSSVDTVYSPADSHYDWLFAKMMFNTANLYGTQLAHLVTTHDKAEIILEAAMRTLSIDHPVYAMMRRLGYQAYAMRPAAAALLVNPGGAIDQAFPYPGKQVPSAANETYFNMGGGSVMGAYFNTSLRSRGLIDCSYGPELQHFPFKEDAGTITSAMKTFMTAFVESYYDDAAINTDQELQNWLAEAGPAGIIDFPKSMNGTQDLVDLLSFYAYLVGIVHQVINSNEPVTSIATLPYYPSAYSKQLPTTKNMTEAMILEYMPGFNQSLQQIAVFAAFSRGSWKDSNYTLAYMFDDADMLGRMNQQTAAAADTFKSDMSIFSDTVRARTWDSNGLIQGMPIRWQTLDTKLAPRFLTI